MKDYSECKHCANKHQDCGEFAETVVNSSGISRCNSFAQMTEQQLLNELNKVKIAKKKAVQELADTSIKDPKWSDLVAKENKLWEMEDEAEAAWRIAQIENGKTIKFCRPGIGAPKAVREVIQEANDLLNSNYWKLMIKPKKNGLKAYFDSNNGIEEAFGGTYKEKGVWWISSLVMEQFDSIGYDVSTKQWFIRRSYDGEDSLIEKSEISTIHQAAYEIYCAHSG